jgi:hypothetical protein
MVMTRAIVTRDALECYGAFRCCYRKAQKR